MEEMKRLFPQYLEQIIIEDEMSIPDFLPASIKRINVKSIADLMSTVLTTRETKYTLVLTKTKAAFDMLTALNANCKDHHIAGFCDSGEKQWMYQELLDEFHRIENTRFDKDGNPHVLKGAPYEGIFVTEQDEIVVYASQKMHALPDNLPLYRAKNGQDIFGYLLTDSEYRGTYCLGFLTTISLPTAKRAELAANLFSSLEENCFPQPESILAFQYGRCLATQYVIPEKPDQAFHKICEKVLFNYIPENVSDPVVAVLEELRDSYERMPDYLLRAIEEAYILNHPLSFQKWKMLFSLWGQEMNENSVK